jgi:hypothetical protein
MSKGVKRTRLLGIGIARIDDWAVDDDGADTLVAEMYGSII